VVFPPTLRRFLNLVRPLLVAVLIAESIILLRQNQHLKTELPLPPALTLHREQPLHDVGAPVFGARLHPRWFTYFS